MIAPSFKKWILGFVLVLPFYTADVAAARGGGAVPPSNLVQQPAISVEQATAIARLETSGRVLSATPIEGGNRGYRVRVLLEGGRVTTVVIDRKGGVRKGR